MPNNEFSSTSLEYLRELSFEELLERYECLYELNKCNHQLNQSLMIDIDILLKMLKNEQDRVRLLEN
jgi:hypothetical protein